jgi:hypothetical protein
MRPGTIDAYCGQIEQEAQAGSATEHTHRPALKTLIESLASGVTATNEPKRAECGVPDFALTEKGELGPLGLTDIVTRPVYPGRWPGCENPFFG